MSKLDYKIGEKYSIEISKIKEILNNLENNRVYDITGVQSDGYLTTNIDKLKNELIELLSKIQTNAPSTEEKMDSYFK